MDQKEVKSNQNTQGVKRGGQELKQALLKEMWNQMGVQCLLVLIGLKVLVMMNSLQNTVISGAQNLLMLMGSNFWWRWPGLKTLLLS